MRIEFTSITIKNFRSFVGAAQQLDFSSLPLGVCFLRGENEVEESLGANGSGKTTIWNALSWCLFGKTPDGLRNPDIIPWLSDKAQSPKVSVDLLVDNQSCVVTRTASPNSLRVNDKDANQEKVEKLIGLNFEIFTHTVLFGQDRDLFFDLSASDKLALFTDALELNRWDSRSQHASEEARRLEMDLVAAERDLAAAKAQAKRTKELLDAAQEKSDDFEENRFSYLQILKAEVKKLQGEEKSAVDKRDDAFLLEDGALAEKKALDVQFRKEYDVLFALRDQLSTSVEKIEQKRVRLRELRRDLSTLDESKECPACGQMLRKSTLREHKDKLEKKIAAITAEIIDINVVAIEKKYNAQDKKIDRLRPAIEEKEKVANAAKSELDMWNQRLQEIQVKLQIAEKGLKRLEADENPYQDQVSKFKRELKKQKAAAVELDGANIALAKKITRTKFWIKGFKDVRLFLLEEVLSELELATNSMLADVGLHDWSIAYDVEQETKSGTTKRGLVVKVTSPHNEDSVRWECWSGGERQRLRLVGAMALSEVLLSYAGVEVDTEIFDEPTRSLSEGGVRDLCEFLHSRARDLKKRIWYTDHHTTESSLFSAVVTVRKTVDRGSRIFTS